MDNPLYVGQSGAQYAYRYTLEIHPGVYRNFSTFADVAQYRAVNGVDGTLYTPDGHPINESEITRYIKHHES